MYGGTKAELQRLIKDASTYTDIQKEMGIAVDASSMSFDNIVNAIAVVQGKLGIAGATSLEAATTIEGSINSMKAAWSNLVTGIADDNADFDKLIDDFVKSVETAGKNILPRVNTALKGAAKLVSKLAPTIAKELPKLMGEILPDLADATANLIIELAQQIPGMVESLIDAANEVVDKVGDAFAKKIPELAFIFENLREIIWSVIAALVAYKTAMAITSVITAVTKATEGMTIAQVALNAVMKANPIALLVAAIAGLIIYLATLEDSVKDVTEAQEDLNKVRKTLIDAEAAYTDAIKAEEKALRDLNKAEKENKISAEELAEQVENGTLTYKEMTEGQREVYDAYLQVKEAQDALKTSTEEYTNSKREEQLASLEYQLSLAKEKGNYDELKSSVVEAFNKGKISAEDAKSFIGRAMSDMSLSSQQTFQTDIPSAITDGLNPTKYANAMENTKRNFRYMGDDIKWVFQNFGGYAQSAWNAIKNVFAPIGEWFKSKFQESKQNTIIVWNNIKTKFSEIGKNIVQGIKDGISKAWGGLKKWFKGLWSDLVSGVKNLLGIHSPSRVFAGIGRNMALGVGEGWEDAFGDVEDDIDNSLDFGEADYGITTSSTSIGDFGGGSSAYGSGGSQNVNVTVGIDDSANALGLARALLPFLKIAEKEVYA